MNAISEISCTGNYLSDIAFQTVNYGVSGAIITGISSGFLQFLLDSYNKQNGEVYLKPQEAMPLVFATAFVGGAMGTVGGLIKGVLEGLQCARQAVQNASAPLHERKIEVKG